MAIQTFKAYFDTARLALAAYSEFANSRGANGVVDESEVRRQLSERNRDKDFTVGGADEFTRSFEVVDQFTDPSLLFNGFSATVFRHKQTGQLYFVPRGTENSGDYLADGALAIGITARAQIVSMVNYFLRLQAGAGNSAKQIKASSILPSDGVEWDQSRAVQGVGSGLNLNQLVVAGHSLGGYLTTIFGRIFNDKVAAAYTFNAPGAYGGFGLLDNIARLLGGTPRGFLDSSRQTNLVGDYIVSSIPGRHGQNVRIFEESDAHSQKAVADTLALSALFGELDSDIKAADIRDIVRASAPKDSDSLEASLDSLRRLFLGPQLTLTKQPGTGDSDTIRETFYQNTGELRDNPAFRAWAGQVGVLSLVTGPADGWQSSAAGDVAYRYALKELNPFAITGAPGLYDQYNGNGELAMYDPASGQGVLTSEWLRDRAQFLAWKNHKNLNDIADGVAIRRKDNGAESYLYTDKTLKDSLGQDYSIRVVGGSPVQQIDPIRISFAGNSGSALQGGNYADHLYGGKGGDVLAGGDGDDYLEGGAGNDVLGGDGGDDKLIGGSGADTLAGGAGDDNLVGGRGSDVLQGGPGDDVYFIGAADGQDTIVDYEGHNSIVYADANGTRSVFAVAAWGQSGAWVGYLDGGERVDVVRGSNLVASVSDGRQIVIAGYQDGDFGIQLNDAVQPNAITLIFHGDLELQTGSDVDEYGNIRRDPDIPAPNTPDWFRGSEGNDFIAGYGGNDCLYGRSGADHLQGGKGSDRIYGESGDDVIEGQDIAAADGGDSGVDYIAGGEGDDSIFATVASDIPTAIAQANEVGTGNSGGRFWGGPGDDVIIGSGGTERLAGGAGADVLVGGGRNDSIYGDGDLDEIWNLDEDPTADETTDNGDAIYGGAGVDRIWAGLGDDYADGGDGDDAIYGESGADVLFGGAGDDYILAMVEDIAFDVTDDCIDGGDGNDYIFGSYGDNVLLGGAGDDDVGGAGGDDFVDGGPGNDRIQGNDAHGGAGDDVIAGTAGADTLYGDEGNDALAGWNWCWRDPFDMGQDFSPLNYGEDWFYGGAGDDTYLFALGTGSAHIVDDSGFNRIVLRSEDLFSAGSSAAIARDSIRLVYAGGIYTLLYGNSGDSIELGAVISDTSLGVYLNHVVPDAPIEAGLQPDRNLVYRPGEDAYNELLRWSDIGLRQDAAPEGGTLTAVEGISNTLEGNSGSDTIVGASGDDLLRGDAGDDTLDGGDGGDRYVFNPGDGVDVIADSGTQGADTLAFGTGISADALTLGTGSLLIRIGDTGDAIHIDGFDLEDALADGGIEFFEFADGTVLSHAQLVSRGFDLYGTDEDDTTYGTSLVDRFHQSAGDDTLIGGSGDDAYYFDAGSGHDLVVDQDATQGNTDTLVLGSGITPENLSILSSPGMLSLALAGSGDSLDIQWQPQDGYAIERISFADGTVWDGSRLEAQAAPASPADDSAQVPGGSEATAPDGGGAAADNGAATQPADNTVPVVNGGAAPAEAEPTDAGAEAPVASETEPSEPANSPVAEAAPIAAVTEPPAAAAPAEVEVVQVAGDAASPAHTDLTDVGTAAPAQGEVAQADIGEVPPAAAEPPAAIADAVSTDSIGSPESVEQAIAEDALSVAGGRSPSTDDGTSPLPATQPTAVDKRPDSWLATLAAAGTIDAAAALLQPRNNSQQADGFAALAASEQAPAAPGPAAFFAALQPSRPNLQSWLDSWLGPGARANTPARDMSTAASSGEDNQPTSTQDSPPSTMHDADPPHPTGDDTEPPAAGALTPEEIAQSYEYIALWLTANSGLEADIAGEGGAMPERNLFRFMHSSAASASGVASTVAFGQSPGLAAIGGQSLQPLRGISEGCAALALA